ncbi:MAG TPA: glycosyltransferase [Terriglobales bacterium]|nr:glycosyltransferase [Terriglobales bacterium]
MRILHVVGKLDYGGVETWLVQVLRHIDRQKYQMDFLVHTTDPGMYDEEVRALGARIIPCLGPSNPLRYALNFRRMLRAYGPYDVVHSHVHHYSGYVLMLATMAGVPVRIAHSHSAPRSAEASRGMARSAYLRTPYRRTIYRRTMQAMIGLCATRGLAVSGEAGDHLFCKNWRNYPKQWQLQHLGIDLSRFDIPVDRNSLRRAIGISSDALVIGHVGRFVVPKNHAFLVEIARELVKLEPNAVFLLVGDGPLRAEIEAKVNGYAIEKHFIFAGPRSDVPALMKGVMDVFLFPSLYEGLGLALLEAQAAGLTSIVSDLVPGESDVIPNLVDRLALGNSAPTWAHAVLAGARRRERPNWCQLMDGLAGRSIESSVESLVATYQRTQRTERYAPASDRFS